jgi:hypothetical protein
MYSRPVVDPETFFKSPLECDAPTIPKYIQTTFTVRQLKRYRDRGAATLTFTKAPAVEATTPIKRKSYSHMQKAIGVTLVKGKKHHEEVARTLGLSSKAIFPWTKEKAKSAFIPELSTVESWSRPSLPGEEGDRNLDDILGMSLSSLSDAELLKLWKHYDPKQGQVHPIYLSLNEAAAEEEERRHR